MKRWMRILFTVFRVGIGVALLVYLGTSGAINWSALLGLASAWPITLLALVTLLLDLVVTAWRLCVLFKARGLHLSIWASTKLTLIGTFFNACLPGSTGGDVIKIYYAAEGNRGRRTEVATIILLDRVVGMFALMVWPLVAALFFPRLIEQLPVLRGLLWGAAVIAAILLLGFLLCRSVRLRNSRLVLWAFRALPLGHYAQRIFDTVHAYRHNTGALLATVAISMLAHTMSTGITMLMAIATHPGPVAWKMAVLIPLGHLANTLPVTPGGLGVGEAAFDKLFAMAGLNGGAEALLGWRLLTILASLTGIPFYMQGRKRLVHLAEEVSDETPAS